MINTTSSTNTVWHNATVTRERRERLHGHRGAVLWFTGLSGAGKSTLANAVEEQLHRINCRTFVYDGDNVRHGLCANLGFSSADRAENIRRVGEVVKLFLDSGGIALAAFISPFRVDRNRVRQLIPSGDFVEIYCQASLGVCEQRDTKGHYKKAREGLITEFTGISSPYEVPENAELIVDTGSLPLDHCVGTVIDYLRLRNIISPTSP